MVLVCLPSDALSQHLLSYLGFSYLERGVSLHGGSSKAQPLLLTLDEGYLLTAAPPDLERDVAPLCPPGHSSRSLQVGLLHSAAAPASQLFHSLVHLHQKALYFLFLFCHRVVSSAYLRLLIFLVAILIPACALSSRAFLMMYSAYKLNKQGDSIQP